MNSKLIATVIGIVLAAVIAFFGLTGRSIAERPDRDEVKGMIDGATIAKDQVYIQDRKLFLDMLEQTNQKLDALREAVEEHTDSIQRLEDVLRNP